MTNEAYKKYAEKRANGSPVAKNTAKAFVVGGTICAVGQGLLYLYSSLGADTRLAYTLVSVTLIFVSVVLTGLDLYDGLAKFGGAGTLVPITGFANAVVSPAIDTKTEGYVLGIGVKLFTVAGPVILFGTLASVVYGALLYIWRFI
jgi:stage V sporulation protein AC